MCLPTEQEIAARLQTARNLPVENPFPPGFLPGEPRQAAVLIPLIRMKSQWHVLFIRRAHHPQDPHSSQVAFPGGGAHPGDPGLAGTALRETEEEIGLPPEAVTLLGQMHPFDTVTNYRVTPFVGVIPWPFPLRLEEREVSRAFTIPLTWLVDPHNRVEQVRILPDPYKPVRVIYYNTYDGEVLWGASARFMTRFIELIFP